MSKEVDMDLMRKYAMVFPDMLHVLNKNPDMDFGTAMDVVLKEQELEDPPDEVKYAILKLVFQTVTSGRIKGCPDA